MVITKTRKPTSISTPIAVCGFAIGFVFSLGILSGDDQGRVNLLYLLMVFMVIPVIGAGLSVYSLLASKRINAAQFIVALPIWPPSFGHYLHKLHQQKMDKQWLFLQSQIAALAYSVATLLGFAGLLLVTDINFVWRSTLVDAEQLHSVLTIIAKPWYFWDAAQPSLDLLLATQDSRLNSEYGSVEQYGRWWPFILALHAFYAFLLRGLLYALGVGVLIRAEHANIEALRNINSLQVTAPSPEKHTLAPVTSQLPNDIVLANWAKFSDETIATLPFTAAKCIDVGPELDEDELSALLTTHSKQLVIVKSWEPPMGELEDYIVNGQGLLLPVDISNHCLLAPKTNHLQEWQRFVEKTANWQVFQPAEWTSEQEQNDAK